MTKETFKGTNPFSQIIKDKKISRERLAEMWCQLNRWEIPEEFKGEIPVHSFNNSEKGAVAMKAIKRLIGQAKCIEQWNLNRQKESLKVEEVLNEDHT